MFVNYSSVTLSFILNKVWKPHILYLNINSAFQFHFQQGTIDFLKTVFVMLTHKKIRTDDSSAMMDQNFAT